MMYFFKTYEKAGISCLIPLDGDVPETERPIHLFDETDFEKNPGKTPFYDPLTDSVVWETIPEN